MDALTDAQLDELERLHASASPDWCEDMEGAPPCPIVSGDPCGDAPVIGWMNSVDDGVLAVQMHLCLPALIAEVRRYRREKALDALSRQAQGRGEYNQLGGSK